MRRMFGAALIAMCCACELQGQGSQVAIRPWVSAGVGGTSNMMRGPYFDMNRREGGPSAMVAGGLLFREKYIIGVQQGQWQGMSFEWGERGSNTAATVGMIFRDITATPLLRVNAGKAAYRRGSDHHYQAAVLGAGVGVVAFPRWVFSPAVTFDLSWWINGRAVRGPEAGASVGNRQMTITLALIAH